MIYGNISELIGNTPIIELKGIEKKYDLKAAIYAKLESYNPAGSIKDRVAYAIISEAEESGRLKPGGTIIEPTSGNTGIGLACIAAVKGYRMIIVIPDSMSIERRNIIKAYGAEIVLTDGTLGMKGAIARANELAEEIEGSIIAGQFVNPANPLAHMKTTGPEIWNDMEGRIDVFIAGVGTGGTVTGTGRYLKERSKDIKIVAVEPAASAVLSGEKPGSHKIQGIGAGFVPDILDTDIYDEIFRADNESAFEYGRELAHTEGILVGISSGAALQAAVEIAKREENAGKNILVIFPDGGDRYFSTPLFAE